MFACLDIFGFRKKKKREDAAILVCCAKSFNQCTNISQEQNPNIFAVNHHTRTLFTDEAEAEITWTSAITLPHTNKLKDIILQKH